MVDRHQRLELEGARLSVTYPSLTLAVGAEGAGLVSGHLNVTDEVSYTVTLYIPAEYPKREPVLFCDPGEIPWKLDRHVYENSKGVACLCGRCETRVLWPWGSDLTDFVSKLVYPYFVGQFYYETHGTWPATGERSHGKPGIMETFYDLLTEIEEPSDAQIVAFLRLLARKNSPKGHESCPCGSGRRLRSCHRGLIERLRSIVDPRHAALDLREALNGHGIDPK
jgi:hypothetical protein